MKQNKEQIEKLQNRIEETETTTIELERSRKGVPKRLMLNVKN